MGMPFSIQFFPSLSRAGKNSQGFSFYICKKQTPQDKKE
jgi:hypothetical protein